MKQNKTRWLFVATVAIFWLALLLTVALPKRYRADETTTLNYTIPANITKLHIDDINYLRTYSGANIEFTQGEHITLEIDNNGLDQSPQDASTLFEQRGEQLVLRQLPVDTNKPDDNHRVSWRVTKILLPTAITEVSSNSEGIKVSGGVQVPKLTIRSGKEIMINNAKIDQLNIYSHNLHCGRKVKAIEIEHSTIQQLYIENHHGLIDIQGGDTIGKITLHTMPYSILKLNPISDIKRIQWQALDKSRENRLCQSTSIPNHTIKQDK